MYEGARLELCFVFQSQKSLSTNAHKSVFECRPAWELQALLAHCISTAMRATKPGNLPHNDFSVNTALFLVLVPSIPFKYRAIRVKVRLNE